MTEGSDHKLLKNKIAEKYESKGYQIEKEYTCENGMIVDVAAKKDDETIFFEVGTLNGEDRLEKLKHYADKVVHNPQIEKPDVRERDGIVHMVIGEESKKKLQEIAEKEHRSMTSQVRWWIKNEHKRVVAE